LLDLVENFTLFPEHRAGLVIMVGQHHRFLGVNNSIVTVLVERIHIRLASAAGW
jgi:type I restriction enzyme, R subunit